MRKKYLIIIFFLAIILFPFKSFALEESIEDNSDIENEEEVSVITNTGQWIHENGEDYYIVNGKKVEGFQTIDGKTYFFGLGSARLLRGWQSLGSNKKFYLNKDGSVTQGWQHIDNEDYYARANFMLEGFQNIDGKTYFFGLGSARLLRGWQGLNNKKFYLNKDGSVTQGWQHINNEDYYVKDNFMVDSFQTIDDKTYFFGLGSARLLRGWQSLGPNKKFYLNKDGSVTQGWQHIDNEDYYVRDNFMLEGFQNIDDKTYFFGLGSARLLRGWQGLNNKKFYLNKDGSITQGWQHIGNEDYYARDNFMLEGFQNIDGKTYFFGLGSARLLRGWQGLNNKKFYLYEDGSVKEGENIIDGKTYYVVNHYVVNGFQEIDGKIYYFDDKGKRTGRVKDKNTNNVIVLDDVTGEYIMTQYIPYYYNQKDLRWKNVLYLKGTMGGTGCGPTSMAMAFQSILGKTILPIDVANYLYYNTNTFDRQYDGISGLAIFEAAKHWNIKVEPVNSVEELDEQLKSGKIVYAAMTNGKFATLLWNHAIVMSEYKDGKTNAYDPLKENNNGWVETTRIWNEQSKDPEDRLGGASIYALSKN